MNGQHDRPVVGMQVEKNRRTDEVLGEVAKERNSPDTQNEKIISISVTYLVFGI